MTQASQGSSGTAFCAKPRASRPRTPNSRNTHETPRLPHTLRPCPGINPVALIGCTTHQGNLRRERRATPLYPEKIEGGPLRGRRLRQLHVPLGRSLCGTGTSDLGRVPGHERGQHKRSREHQGILPGPERVRARRGARGDAHRSYRRLPSRALARRGLRDAVQFDGHRLPLPAGATPLPGQEEGSGRSPGQPLLHRGSPSRLQPHLRTGPRLFHGGLPPAPSQRTGRGGRNQVLRPIIRNQAAKLIT